jgi:hypothetical protein
VCDENSQQVDGLWREVQLLLAAEKLACIRIERELTETEFHRLAKNPENANDFPKTPWWKASILAAEVTMLTNAVLPATSRWPRCRVDITTVTSS